MKSIQKILTDLRTQPHCFLTTAYAVDLEARLVKALDDWDNNTDEQDSDEPPVLKVSNGVAQIDINGTIAKRVGLSQDWLSIFGLVDLDYVDCLTKAAIADSNVSCILYNVTSPGGFLSGLATTHNLIASSPKPTYVYSDIQNASAAYWISSAADSIIISPECEIGSIGVFTTLINYSQQLKSQGIDVKILKSGDYKAMGSDLVPWSDDDLAIIQSQIDSYGAEFRDTVSSQRNISPDNMQGLVYRGVNAIKLGFADSIANCLDDVMTALK